MQNAEEEMRRIKDEIAATDKGDNEQQESLPLEDVVNEEVVQKEDLGVEDEQEEPVVEEVEEDEGAEDAPASETEQDPKSTKQLRKNIEKGYKKKLKARDAELKELRDNMAKMQLEQAQQRGYQEALKAQEAPAAPTDPEPDQVLDPEDHQSWKMRQLEKENQTLKASQEEHGAFIQQQKDRQAISNLVTDYKQRNPESDYEGARQFLRERESRMIKLQHPTATVSQINDHLDTVEVSVFKTLANQHRNATDEIFNIATEQGYEPKVAKARVTKKPNLGKIKENQEKNASLIGGTGAVKDTKITSDRIFNMSIGQLAAGGPDLFKKAHQSVARLG